MTLRNRWVNALLLVLLLSRCAGMHQIENSLDRAALDQIDHAIRSAVADGHIAGGVIWLERRGSIHNRPSGLQVTGARAEAMAIDTIFDVASLTKVIATAPCMMLLVERGRAGLDDPLFRYFPRFRGEGRENITIRHLMTHTSGLRAGLRQKDWSGREMGIELALAESPLDTPGTVLRYSDLNSILLAAVVETVSGRPLEQFAREEIFEPLRMNDTLFLPPPSLFSRIAPTSSGADSRGVVHDPTARRMDGVAGHAGLFTTAYDLAIFARMLLGGGAVHGVRLFRPETVALMTSVQTPSTISARRGLGWDIDTTFSGARGSLFPPGSSFGHTGFTGTSIWIDPSSQTFVIFLTSALYPHGRGEVRELRKTIGTLAARAAGYRERAQQPVLNGIDSLARQEFAPLEGSRIGLITNHTGRDRNGRSTIDILHSAARTQLVALFSPEHGIRGAVDEKVGDSIDEKTRLPVYSLYGATRRPLPEQLTGIDTLVFDIQDIGTRFYTYISTMALAMEAAKERGIRFVVLDRVNPVSGHHLEGPLAEGESHFTAIHPLPVRHGMTAGELARMFNEEKRIGVDLEVIKLEGWSRSTWLDQSQLAWINPSPNMRSLTAATLYPGVALLEATTISVGRGTETPFELIGAPFIDAEQLVAALRDEKLPGIAFEPVEFTPSASMYKGEQCRGVRMKITDREALRPVDAGIALALLLHRLYPQEFDLERVNLLLRHRPTIEAIRQRRSLQQIRQLWVPEIEDFLKRREPFLLYR